MLCLTIVIDLIKPYYNFFSVACNHCENRWLKIVGAIINLLYTLTIMLHTNTKKLTKRLGVVFVYSMFVFKNMLGNTTFFYCSVFKISHVLFNSQFEGSLCLPNTVFVTVFTTFFVYFWLFINWCFILRISQDIL